MNRATGSHRSKRYSYFSASRCSRVRLWKTVRSRLLAGERLLRSKFQFSTTWKRRCATCYTRWFISSATVVYPRACALFYRSNIPSDVLINLLLGNVSTPIFTRLRYEFQSLAYLVSLRFHKFHSKPLARILSKLPAGGFYFLPLSRKMDRRKVDLSSRDA